jgi:hypothetical protein
MILDDGHSRQGHFARAALARPCQEESDRDLSGSGPRTALCRPRGTALRTPSRRYTHRASWRLQHLAQTVQVDRGHVQVEGIQYAVGQRVVITKPGSQPIAPMRTPKPRMSPAGFHTSPPRRHRCRPPRRMARWCACQYEWRRTAALSLHPPTLWQVAVRPAVPARTPGIALSAIASGLQKRMKACIEAIAFVDRLKAGLKSLPQFLSRRLHSRVPLPS